MNKIRNCSSFTHEFSTVSGAMSDTQVVATSGQTIVLSSIFSSLKFTSAFVAVIPSGSIANIPRIHLTDSDDNVVFGIVPTHYPEYANLGSANSIPNSMFFQIPGRGLRFENGLKVVAIAPAPSSGGMRLTVNLVYQT
tara:strand:+ start:597 stop:1010 length:414 start_codon:yes stop_codon:yes gene_type:complete